MTIQTKNILRIAGFGSKMDMIELGICPTCNHIVKTDYMNDIQKDAYENTGMCVDCQKQIY